MPAGRVTGHLRIIERGGTPTYYASLRTADGRRLTRRLGLVWPNRSRPPAGHLTRSQAEGELARVIAGHHPGIPVAPTSGATFADAAREWLRYVEHDRRRERSTVIGYRQVVEHRLLPTFGPLPLEAIYTATAERWRCNLLADGLSASTVNKLRWTAEAIINRAQTVWEIERNPFARLERQPHRPSNDFQILAPDEILLLATAASDDQDRAFYTVAGFTGLRLGELLALQWDDLDFASRLVHVRRSYTRGQLKAPKSGRVRSVPMIDQVIGPLDRLSRRPHFTAPTDLVFSNTVGNPIEESALRRRFYLALKRAGLKRVRLHDLRHSYCSLAVRAYRLDEVKAYAGHADIAMTMRYVHHVPAHDAADRLSRIVTAASVLPPVLPPVLPTPDIHAN